MECQRGDTVRGAATRVVRTGVGRVAVTGALLAASFSSCVAIAGELVRVLGHTLGSSLLLLVIAKAGLAIISSKNKKIEEFICIVPKTIVLSKMQALCKSLQGSRILALFFKNVWACDI